MDGKRNVISYEWRVMKALSVASGGLSKSDQLRVEGNEGVISFEWRVIKA